MSNCVEHATTWNAWYGILIGSPLKLFGENVSCDTNFCRQQLKNAPSDSDSFSSRRVAWKYIMFGWCVLFVKIIILADPPTHLPPQSFIRKNSLTRVNTRVRRSAGNQKTINRNCSRSGMNCFRSSVLKISIHGSKSLVDGGSLWGSFSQMRVVIRYRWLSDRTATETEQYCGTSVQVYSIDGCVHTNNDWFVR